jgi:hypothetical protein
LDILGDYIGHFGRLYWTFWAIILNILGDYILGDYIGHFGRLYFGRLYWTFWAIILDILGDFFYKNIFCGRWHAHNSQRFFPTFGDKNWRFPENKCCDHFFEKVKKAPKNVPRYLLFWVAFSGNKLLQPKGSLRRGISTSDQVGD